MGGRLSRGSAASCQTIPTPSSPTPTIRHTLPCMADFINIVHEDLTGQLARIPRAAFPAFADKGWTIASDADEGPSGRSKFVEEARRERAEEVAELTEKAHAASAAAASKVEAAAVKTAAENVEEPAAEAPKPVRKTTTKESKT